MNRTMVPSGFRNRMPLPCMDLELHARRGNRETGCFSRQEFEPSCRTKQSQLFHGYVLVGVTVMSTRDHMVLAALEK
jgi:hypothetical protein